MSNLNELLVGGAVLVAALGLFLLVRFLVERRRGRLERRLKSTEESGILRAGGGAPAPAAGFAGRMDRGFDRMVERAGLGLSAQQALGIMALAGVALAAALYLWRERIPLAMGGLAFGLVVPLLVFWFYRGRQRRLMQSQLPDAYYLIARSLRAGLPLPQAIRLVGEEGVKPLADEFRRCAAAMELGLPVSTAVQMMAERVQLLDFNSFVSTVAFQQSAGGNLPLLLDRLAAGARDRNHFRGQFLASTAQGRITALTIGLATPALLVGYALFEPEHVQPFFQDPRGWAALGVAAVLQLIGVVWLYQILSVDY